MPLGRFGEAVCLGQLKALGFDQGSYIFIEFSDLFAVGIAAYRFKESGQEVITNFQAIPLAFEAKVYNHQLSPLTNVWVGAVLCVSGHT